MKLARFLDTQHLGCLGLALALVLGVTAPATAANSSLERAQALIDNGQPGKALEILEGQRGRLSPEGLLLRGSARIMLGELQTGTADLEQAVARDPALRQAWLNLAGLEIAERDFENAYQLLKKAEAIEPQAPDNNLNLGAVLVMMGRSDEASQHLERYLEVAGKDAEAYYLVAANYALGGMSDYVVQHLEQAVGLDERMRLRARRDDRFGMIDSLGYKALLHTDSWQPPQAYHQTAAGFRQPYSASDSKLLYAVLDAMRDLGIRYHPEIEATSRWALVWGDLRVKIATQDNGSGVVRLSAPPDAFTTQAWQQKTQALFKAVHQRLGG